MSRVSRMFHIHKQNPRNMYLAYGMQKVDESFRKCAFETKPMSVLKRLRQRLHELCRLFECLRRPNLINWIRIVAICKMVLNCQTRLDLYVLDSLNQILIFHVQVFRHLAQGYRAKFSEESICNANKSAGTVSDDGNMTSTVSYRMFAI